MLAILAHGALGPFDEIIFLGIAVVFLAMMAISWVRSQQLTEELDEKQEEKQEEESRQELDYFELE